MNDEETSTAAWEAVKGGLVGSLKWGAASAVVGFLAYTRYPIYRQTTVQFKV